MEIGRKFSELTIEEYFFYIDNYKRYNDFNTLGLYRSILENEKLNLDMKIEVREYAHKKFKKTFEFLQLKDPKVFVEVSTLGHQLTKGDEINIWNNVKKNQQKILSDKRIKHRNFGTYSKHNCPYEDCIWQGLMVRPGSRLAESSMHFISDSINRYQQKSKANKQTSDRKNEKQIIDWEVSNS